MKRPTVPADYDRIMQRLRSLANAKAVAGMARFGIDPKNALGISIPQLRALGREIGRDHALALRLWSSGVHEARILAGLVADPEKLTEYQMEQWARDFSSWDVCDQCCSNLFDKTPFAYAKAVEWADRDEEFVKRAGFVLMAVLAVHDMEAADSRFVKFLPIIKRHAQDDRNFVKKAVNWALRQIGKRNARLNARAIAAAQAISRLDSRSARWIATDALRELAGPAVQRRIR